MNCITTDETSDKAVIQRDATVYMEVRFSRRTVAFFDADIPSTIYETRVSSCFWKSMTFVLRRMKYVRKPFI